MYTYVSCIHIGGNADRAGEGERHAELAEEGQRHRRQLRPPVVSILAGRPRDTSPSYDKRITIV